MDREIVQRATRTPKRNSLYHFTRTSNLASLAASDALYASDAVHSNPHGEWRREKESHEVHGNQVTLNAHLYISPEIMASDTSVEEFRAFLDHHVFLWPTLRLCGQMLQMYIRREPRVFHPEIGCPPS